MVCAAGVLVCRSAEFGTKRASLQTEPTEIGPPFAQKKREPVVVCEERDRDIGLKTRVGCRASHSTVGGVAVDREENPTHASLRNAAITTNRAVSAGWWGWAEERVVKRS